MPEDVLNYKTNIKAGSGKLLISEPQLQDQEFYKTVIFMCHHDEHESVGYVLNRLSEKNLSHILPQLNHHSFPLHIGGPVGLDSLHILHSVPELIEGDQIQDSIYWGGDLEAAIENILLGRITPQQCKFFLGYSGWSAGQLESELDLNAWLVANASLRLVFETDAQVLWKQAIAGLGQKFNPLLFVPLNPELN